MFKNDGLYTDEGIVEALKIWKEFEEKEMSSEREMEERGRRTGS